MINKTDLDKIMKDFDANPERLAADSAFAQKFHIALMLGNVETSITALNAIIENSNIVYYTNLKNAWAEFLKQAKLP